MRAIIISIHKKTIIILVDFNAEPSLLGFRRDCFASGSLYTYIYTYRLRITTLQRSANETTENQVKKC